MAGQPVLNRLDKAKIRSINKAEGVYSGLRKNNLATDWQRRIRFRDQLPGGAPMPTFEFEMPDKQLLSIEAPDHAAAFGIARRWLAENGPTDNPQLARAKAAIAAVRQRLESEAPQQALAVNPQAQERMAFDTWAKT